MSKQTVEYTRVYISDEKRKNFKLHGGTNLSAFVRDCVDEYIATHPVLEKDWPIEI